MRESKQAFREPLDLGAGTETHSSALRPADGDSIVEFFLLPIPYFSINNSSTYYLTNICYFRIMP